MSCFSENEEEEELIDQKLKDYEDIFEEIQNFEVSEKALDKIEGVLDENVQLKQDNLEMKRQIEEMQATIEVQSFKGVAEGIRKRQGLEPLKPNGGQPPPPPPPPMTPQSVAGFKPKYRILFWQKLLSVQGTVFEKYEKQKIKASSLAKFPFVQTKNLGLPLPSAAKRSIIDHKREITVSSVFRVLGLSPEQVIKKIKALSSEIFEDIDKIRVLYRVLPTETECEELQSYDFNGGKLNINEKFLYDLSNIPHLRVFMDCVYYKLNFPSVLEDLMLCFTNWKNLSMRLINNKRLKNFLHLILSFGNELNQNHPKFGNCSGFKISFLNDLVSIKSSSDHSTLLDVIIEDYYFLYGNPHIFHLSEHLLLKEIANNSYRLLIESHEAFFQEYCKLMSIEMTAECENIIRNFVKAKQKNVDEEIELLEDMKKSLEAVHIYLGETCEFDDEGRVMLYVALAKFYDKYIEAVNKKWAGLSNRDSKRFTMISEQKLSKKKKF